VVGDPWVLLVLREALTGATRFEQFRALGCADTVLSRRLAAMVEAGLLARSPYRSGNRTREEYLLTDAGRDLLPVVQALAHWGERHRPRASGRLEVVHEACGRVTESADTCSWCHVALTAADVSWRRPRDPSVLHPLVR
jgi:DNA-binding HxlR family transcriptional regulator